MGEGTGFYLDEQDGRDEQDGQDFGLWLATGLPRRCAPRNDRGGHRRAQDERGGLALGFSPSPQPSPIKGEGEGTVLRRAQDGRGIAAGCRWGLFAGYCHCAYCDGCEADWQWLPADAAILAAEQPAAIGAGVHLVCLLGVPFEGDYHVFGVFALA